LDVPSNLIITYSIIGTKDPRNENIIIFFKTYASVNEGKYEKTFPIAITIKKVDTPTKLCTIIDFLLFFKRTKVDQKAQKSTCKSPYNLILILPRKTAVWLFNAN